MRTTPLIIALGIAVAVTFLIEGEAGPRTLHFTIRTPEHGIRVEPTPDGTLVSAVSDRSEALTPLADAGRPALPMRVLNVLIAPGERVASVRATARRQLVVARALTPVLAAQPLPGPDAPAPRVLPEPTDALAPGGDENVWPAQLARYTGSGTWHGYTIASIVVFPLRLESGDLVAATDIDLAIELEAVAGSTDAVRAIRMTPAGAGDVAARLRSMVINPEDADAYPPVPSTRRTGDFSPSALPSLEGSLVDYVIITTEDLAAAFDTLAEWKTAKGVPTTIRTVEWISANYRRGTDLAETIRYFLQDAYTNWGTRYVLLAGDTPEIPPRYLYSKYFYGGTLIPADIYFAGLDGSFNADGDDLFGEQPADAPDLWTELSVGRLPVSTLEAANTMVSKVIAYETPGDPEYTDKVLFLAEVLFPAPWSPGQAILSNGAAITEGIRPAVTSPSRRLARLYETPGLYPGSTQESRLIALDSLEAGYNMVFHVGHGFRFNMHCADDNVSIPDADGLEHPGREFNLYMLNCTAAAFDYDCLGEHMLRNPSGGAVSIIGASNSTFPEPSSYYMAAFANAVYLAGEVHIGDAFAISRASRTALAQVTDGSDLWTHYIYTILADPEMPLWTGPASVPVVSAPDTVDAGTGNLTVQVSVGGQPEEFATVCLWKDGEDYAVGSTDQSGLFSTQFSSALPGSIRVVVTGSDLARREKWITVRPPVGALIVVDSVVVDDDNTGASAGNGDGRIDAGETAELRPVFRNVGDALSAPATASLISPSPNGVVLSDLIAIPAIDPDSTWSPSGPAWLLSTPVSVADGTILRLDVITTHGADTWSDGFAEVVHAPALEFTGLRASDALPLGNGDGVISSGEAYALYVSVKNYGSGRAGTPAGTISALTGGATVTLNASAYPDLDLLMESENTIGFELSETNTSIENPLLVTITDHAGRILTRTIELRPPLPPVIQSFDATLGLDKVKLAWSASPSADVAGYRVYRSSAANGPFAGVTPDLVSHAVFTDAGLAPSTRYYYAVTAVDSSGNESVLSAAASASTNPPQFTGWPNDLVDPSANSPAIGDIDGDGYPEVVVGNKTMYAWHHRGDEVRDGDGLPATFGVFSPLGSDFVGPAALASIDASPGLEIVAAAYTSREVYIFNGNGTVLPGWPRPTVDLVRASVAVGDLDGDGTWEIIAVDQDAYLYAWHADGTEVSDGDANPATDGVFKRLPDTNQWQYQAPAVADLDGDQQDEIIIATQDNKLYVFKGDGSDLAGWPRTLPNYAGGGVAVGDIDNDGDLEIVVTVRSSGETYALHHDNTVMWTRWLQHNLFFNPSPALADLTGDGKLEVIVPSSNGKLYAIQHNGSDAPGWPVTYSTKTYTESSPIVADVTGDGLPDVLLGHEEKLINGWNAAGALLDGFPLVTRDAVRGAPAVVDLDINGDAEIVAVGYDKTVYVWDLTTAYDPTAAPWPMTRANIHRNGVHQSPVASGVGGGAGGGIAFGMVLGQNYPNPFNPSTTIDFELPAGPAERVSLLIYDATGARVRTLMDGLVAGGRHSVRWDGRNHAGSPVGTGVYFYRLSAAHGTETRKMVLLK